MSVIGLRNATTKEIQELHAKYPNGEHITHLPSDGSKLPYNGCFYTNGVYIRDSVALDSSYK